LGGGGRGRIWDGKGGDKLKSLKILSDIGHCKRKGGKNWVVRGRNEGGRGGGVGIFEIKLLLGLVNLGRFHKKEENKGERKDVIFESVSSRGQRKRMHKEKQSLGDKEGEEDHQGSCLRTSFKTESD